MELALITAQQVAVLFLLIGTGMVAVKTGVLKLENKQALSNLLVYIIVPAMVVNSYRMEFSAQILHNLLAAFGMSVLSVLLGTVITLLLTVRKTSSRMPIFRFACIFPTQHTWASRSFRRCLAPRVFCMPVPTLPCSTFCCGRWATVLSAAAPA